MLQKKMVSVQLSSEDAFDQMALSNQSNMGAWLESSLNIADAEGDNYSRLIGTQYKTAVEFSSSSVQTGDFPASISTTNISETGELLWEKSNPPGSSYVAVSTDRSKVIAGNLNDQIDFSGFVVQAIGGQFGTVALSSFDGMPIATSSKMILSNVGKSGNSNVELLPRQDGLPGYFICRHSGIGYSGDAESMCGQGVFDSDTGPIMFDSNTVSVAVIGAAKSIAVQPLNSDGSILIDEATQLPVYVSTVFVEGGYAFDIGSYDATPWFQVTADLPEPFVVEAEDAISVIPIPDVNTNNSGVRNDTSASDGMYLSLESGGELTLALPTIIPVGDYYIEVSLRATEDDGLAEVSSYITGGDSQTKVVSVPDTLQGTWRTSLISDVPIYISSDSNQTLRFEHNQSNNNQIVDIDVVKFYRANMQPLADSDNDGMPNQWEIDNELNPMVADGQLDFDSDGVVNHSEYQSATLANNPDTDGDGVLDGAENMLGTDPLYADSDSDLILDGFDNCVLDINTDQADIDGVGDVCDLIVDAPVISDVTPLYVKKNSIDNVSVYGSGFQEGVTVDVIADFKTRRKLTVSNIVRVNHAEIQFTLTVNKSVRSGKSIGVLVSNPIGDIVDATAANAIYIVK